MESLATMLKTYRQYQISADEALQRLKDGTQVCSWRVALSLSAQDSLDLRKASALRDDPGLQRLASSASWYSAPARELFVVRVAALDSRRLQAVFSMPEFIEYAPLVVLDPGCGITAALEAKFHGSQQPSRIQILVDNLLPPFPGEAPCRPEHSSRGLEANVRWTMAKISTLRKAGRARRRPDEIGRHLRDNDRG